MSSSIVGNKQISSIRVISKYVEVVSSAGGNVDVKLFKICIPIGTQREPLYSYTTANAIPKNVV